MFCDRFRDLISSYIDKDLKKDELKSFEDHLNSCKSCYEEYKKVYNTIDICQNLNEHVPSPDLSKNIMEKIESMDEIKTEIPLTLRFYRSSFFKGIAGIAAVLIIFILIETNLNLSNMIHKDELKTNQEDEMQIQMEHSTEESMINEHDLIPSEGAGIRSTPSIGTHEKNINNEIKQANFTIKVESIENEFNNIVKLAQKYEGYLEEGNKYNGNLIFRIPDNNYYSFINLIESNWELKEKVIKTVMINEHEIEKIEEEDLINYKKDIEYPTIVVFMVKD